MAKFQVLTPIEHDSKLYVAKGATAPHWNLTLGADGQATGYTAPSGGHGRAIPVDASGVIELTELQAGPLRAAGAIGEETREQGTADRGQKKK